MKNLFLAVFLVFVVSSQRAEARSWRQVCGFSGDVLDYIFQTAGEKKSMMISCRSLQGEGSRSMIFYPNGDWLVIYEFYSSGPIEKDVMCIVGSGVKEDPAAEGWTNKTMV